MLIVSSTVGSPIITGWNRRSSAASFSMCFRYSSSVVAPTVCSSPRASIGLSMLDASIAPSAAPAPTTVCSSSMNRITWPAASATSFSTAFRRSSNSPLVLRAGNERTHVEGDDPLVLEAFRHVLPNDALCQPLDDGGLADAGLADEHRVVLGAPGQHLNHAPDLVVSTDDGIELALPRELGEVAAVALECLVGRLRVLAGDALRSANRGERLQDGVTSDAARLQQASGCRTPALGGDRHEKMLRADVFVLQPFRFLLRCVRDLAQPGRQGDLRAAVRARKLPELGADARGKRGRIRIHLAHDLRDNAVPLFKQREEQVLRCDLWMPFAISELLRAEDGFLGFLGVFVDIHNDFSDFLSAS